MKLLVWMKGHEIDKKNKLSSILGSSAVGRLMDVRGLALRLPTGFRREFDFRHSIWNMQRI
jgi:hypothetical protein